MGYARTFSSRVPTADPAGRDGLWISGCCRAILSHFAVGANDAFLGAQDRGELRIVAVDHVDGHLAMRLLLPTAYGSGEMTVDTIGSPSVHLPGLRLSPAIAAAAVGQPVGRLTGHPAFDELDHLLVTDVEERADEDGGRTTVLRFDDCAEPLGGYAHASRRLQ